TERLLETSPAGITADVQHRAEALMGSGGAHLLPDGVRERLDEGRLPGAREPDCLWEHRRATRHEARADLLMDDRWYPAPRLLDGAHLDRAPRRRRRARRPSHCPSPPASL